MFLAFLHTELWDPLMQLFHKIILNQCSLLLFYPIVWCKTQFFQASQLPFAPLPPIACSGPPSCSPVPLSFCLPKTPWTFLSTGDSPLLALIQIFSLWVKLLLSFFSPVVLRNVKRRMCAQSATLKQKHVISVTPMHIISERLHHTLTNNI